MLKKLKGIRGTKGYKIRMSNIETRQEAASIFPEHSLKEKLRLRLNPPKPTTPEISR